MGVTFEGLNKAGQFKIREHDKGILLKFVGKDAKRFTQVNPPQKPRETVKFLFLLRELADMGVLVTSKRVWETVERRRGKFEVVSLTTKQYNEVMHVVWEAMMEESKAHGGFITKNFSINKDFKTQDEADVAVAVAGRALAKMAAQKNKGENQWKT